MRKRNLLLQGVFSLAIVLLAVLAGNQAAAQVTTSTIIGTVTDSKGDGLPGATVVAVHEPSGTRYGTVTNAAGLYTIPGVRVGGPYRVTVTFVGFREENVGGIVANLGTAANVNVALRDESSQLQEVVVSGSRSDVFSSNRTGAATTIGREAINTLPTVSRSLNDFTRLTPQASGSSFGGQDNRLNNITIDGAYFNNSFGLAGQPGGRTGTSPISIDAIEEVQVNIAPYDVRQSNFTGAGINAVTRSGTNEFQGSAFYLFQNQNLLGTKARGVEITKGQFDKKLYGFRLGGPIIKNKLFFFVNGEIEQRVAPATTWLASRPGATGQVSRTLATDLDALSRFLQDSLGYTTGPYENFDAETYANKFLARIDWNINDRHKFNLSYRQLVSGDQVLISNSSSLGFGNRRTNINSMAYQNSGYIQNEDNWALIGELNSTFRNGKASNQLIAGYSFSREDRGQQGGNFPTIDILQSNQTYISTGLDPFTPQNKLNYGTFQLQDNFTYYAGKHTLTAGISLQQIRSENLFFPGSLGVYVYNSLADFYAAARAYLRNPNVTTSPVQYNRFQYRTSLLPGGADPLQILKVTYPGVYIQDEYTATPNLKITAGLRVDVPFFANTALRNPTIDALTFRDENGNAVRYRTDKLPNAAPLWSPRVGFNWDVKGNKTSQLRGGTGIFTGNPPFVWISNQIGGNGVLTALIDDRNARTYGFNPDPAKLIAGATAAPTLDIAVTEPTFKFPQVWRSNLALDQRLPWGLIGTLELIYTKNVNAVKYINANLEAPRANFNYAGDDRPRYPGSPGLIPAGQSLNQALRINDDVVQTIVLQNTNKGYVYSVTAEVKKPFTRGFYGSLAYNFSEAKDLTSAGSIAAGSFTGNATVRGNNYPDLAYSDNDQRHRVVGSLSYRLNYGGDFGGSTAVTLFYNAFNLGRYSYRYTGDFNGDGIFNNDLLYVPRSASDLTFTSYSRTFTVNGQRQTVTFSPEQQAAAFEAFVRQDPYLSKRRGQYAERNGALGQWLSRADLTVIQEFYVKVGGKRNTLQFRADILNVGNLLNNNWGVARIVNTSQPLSGTVDPATGVPTFQFLNITGQDGITPVLPTETFRYGTTTSDVWQAQLGLRYTFN